MYLRKNYHKLSISRKLNSRAFDSFESQGYEFNDHGFIRNDFSQLQERENELGYMRALSQMQEYVSEHSNDGKTFEQIVSEIRPRWCQLNGEVDRFEQYCIDNALDFYNKLKDENTQEGAVAREFADGAGVNVPSEPAVVSNPS